MFVSVLIIVLNFLWEGLHYHVHVHIDLHLLFTYFYAYVYSYISLPFSSEIVHILLSQYTPIVTHNFSLHAYVLPHELA